MDDHKSNNFDETNKGPDGKVTGKMVFNAPPVGGPSLEEMLQMDAAQLAQAQATSGVSANTGTYGQSDDGSQEEAGREQEESKVHIGGPRGPNGGGSAKKKKAAAALMIAAVAGAGYYFMVDQAAPTKKTDNAALLAALNQKAKEMPLPAPAPVMGNVSTASGTAAIPAAAQVAQSTQLPAEPATTTGPQPARIELPKSATRPAAPAKAEPLPEPKTVAAIKPALKPSPVTAIQPETKQTRQMQQTIAPSVTTDRHKDVAMAAAKEDDGAYDSSEAFIKEVAKLKKRKILAQIRSDIFELENKGKKQEKTERYDRPPAPAYPTAALPAPIPLPVEPGAVKQPKKELAKIDVKPLQAEKKETIVEAMPQLPQLIAVNHAAGNALVKLGGYATVQSGDAVGGWAITKIGKNSVTLGSKGFVETIYLQNGK